MREGTLAWVGVVHPLRKQTFMQGYLSTEKFCYLSKTAQQRSGEIARRVHCIRMRSRDDRDKLRRQRAQSLHGLFPVPQETLAHVEATDRIAARTCEATGLAPYVVWEHNNRPARTGLAKAPICRQ